MDRQQTESRIMKLAKFLIAVTASSLLAGCMVGPNYKRPAVQTPAAFRGPDEKQQAEATSFADLPWWQIFEDPQLQELIRTALKQNYDRHRTHQRRPRAGRHYALAPVSASPGECRFQRRQGRQLPDQV